MQKQLQFLSDFDPRMSDKNELGLDLHVSRSYALSAPTRA